MRREPWDWPPEPKRRAKRPPPPLQGEILMPEPEPEPTPRIRIEVTHRYQPRQRQHVPPWPVALVILAALCWISPFGLIIAAVMLGILVTSHPTIAFVVVGMIVLVIVFALRERWHGRRF
jgi:hypothetical protein